MIEVKLGKIAIEMQGGRFPAIDSFNKLLASQISFPVSYRLSKIAEPLNKEIQDFRNARIEIIKKYGDEVKDENGTVTGYQTKEENMATVNQELLAMGDINVSLPGEKFNIDDFKDVNITPGEALHLSWLINET